MTSGTRQCGSFNLHLCLSIRGTSLQFTTDYERQRAIQLFQLGRNVFHERTNTMQFSHQKYIHKSIHLPLSEHDLRLHVRHRSGLEIDVFGALHRSVLQLDVIVKENMREHGLDFVDCEESPRARKRRSMSDLGGKISHSTYHAWRP